MIRTIHTIDRVPRSIIEGVLAPDNACLPKQYRPSVFFETIIIEELYFALNQAPY